MTIARAAESEGGMQGLACLTGQAHRPLSDLALCAHVQDANEQALAMVDSGAGNVVDSEPGFAGPGM